MIEASLPPGVRVTEDGQASLLMTAGSRTVRLTGLTGDLRQLLLQLASAPLIPGAHEAGTPLTQLAERRLVRFTCADGPHELMTATGLGGPCSVDFSPGREEERFRLSRFAYTRNLNGTLVIEVPNRFLRIQILDPGVGSLLADLARGASMTALAESHPAYDKEMVRETMRFLAGTGVIGLESGQGTLDEDTDPDLAPREFHDVAFHSHTRRGLAGSTVGASFPFLGKIPPTPALKPVSAGPLIRLAQPVVADLERRDPPLVTVMEQRRSLRRYGPGLTIDQVGEFLFRVARVRAVVPEDPAAGRLYEVTNRTYPSGGAAYDLEVYLTAGRCAGLEPAIYHYEPAEHALSAVCRDPALTAAMLDSARSAAALEEPPPVLITLASRFNRLSWKYRGICYATTLKNVGVLYEAMYLTATAMGLAPCGLGSGDSAVFSRATGLSPLIESSVGEFMLGRRAPENAP